MSTVNVSRNPKGYGSYIKTLEGSVVQSLPSRYALPFANEVPIVQCWVACHGIAVCNFKGSGIGYAWFRVCWRDLVRLSLDSFRKILISVGYRVDMTTVLWMSIAPGLEDRLLRFAEHAPQLPTLSYTRIAGRSHDDNGLAEKTMLYSFWKKL